MSEFFSTEHFDEIDKIVKANDPAWVLMDGPLGAGKTTFVREYLRYKGMGEEVFVQSPSYLKLFEYEVPKLGLVLHLDLYRFESNKEIISLQLDQYIDRAKLILVEWPQLLINFFKLRPDYSELFEFSNARHLEISEEHDLSFK